MSKREGAWGAHQRVVSTFVRQLMLCSLGALVALAGCGGQVVVSEEDQDSDSALQDDAGAGGSGGSSSGGSSSGSGGSKPAHSGECIACDGQPDCAFCLIHGFTTTYVCPMGEPPHMLGCLHLGEEHTSTNGTFTCYYCAL